MNIAEQVSVVIPVRFIDAFTRVAISELHRIYPGISIYIISDEVIDYTDYEIIQILSPSNNLSDKRNLGVESASTKYIAFLDSDAYPHEGWLETAVTFMNLRDDVGGVGGPNLEYKKLNLDQSIPILAYRSILLNAEPTLPMKEKTMEVNFIISCNFLFRKDEYLELGGMNPNIYTGEDIELCFKYKNNNLKLYFLEDMKVSHKQRMFVGFLKQRFVWGQSVFTVLKYVYPTYLISVLPFIGVLINLGLITYDIFNSSFYFFSAIIVYCLIIFLECMRLTFNPKKILLIYPYLFCSLYALGWGTLYALFFGDINNNYKMYQNKE